MSGYAHLKRRCRLGTTIRNKGSYSQGRFKGASCPQGLVNVRRARPEAKGHKANLLFADRLGSGRVTTSLNVATLQILPKNGRLTSPRAPLFLGWVFPGPEAAQSSDDLICLRGYIASSA